MSNNRTGEFIQTARAELEGLHSTVSDIDARIQDLSRQRAWTVEKARGLEAFLRAEEDGPDSMLSGQSPFAVVTAPESSEEPVLVEVVGSERQLADRLYEILEQANGRDVHYLDLKDAAEKSGWAFVNSETTNRIQVNRILNSDSRFVRPYHRGRYALAKDHPKVQRSVGERR